MPGGRFARKGRKRRLLVSRGRGHNSMALHLSSINRCLGKRTLTDPNSDPATRHEGIARTQVRCITWAAIKFPFISFPGRRSLIPFLHHPDPLFTKQHVQGMPVYMLEQDEK